MCLRCLGMLGYVLTWWQRLVLGIHHLRPVAHRKRHVRLAQAHAHVHGWRVLHDSWVVRLVVLDHRNQSNILISILISLYSFSIYINRHIFLYLLFICGCLFLFLLLLIVRCDTVDALLLLPCFHLLVWLRSHRCRWLLLLLGQVEGRQIVTALFGLYVGVVKQEPLLLLKLCDFAIDPHGSEPAPGERSGVLQPLKHVPWRNLLLSRHLKTLCARDHKTNAKVTEWPAALQHQRGLPLTSFSNPAILLPLVSMSDPWGSQVMTSRVCLGRGSN